MGTRSDWYVGRGKDAEWLGSLAWDGGPDNSDFRDVFHSTDEKQFRARLQALLDGHDDATLPKDGWPWPWEDSNTTDYAYAFDGDRVYGSMFGGPWFEVLLPEPDHDDEEAAAKRGPKPEFPNMESRQNVTFGNRSGLIVLRGG